MTTLAVPHPLIVDLDDTLVRTDTLLEGLANVVFKRPSAIGTVLMAMLRGRAAFKRAVVEAVPLDVAALPYDEAVIAVVRERAALGGVSHLVTAADEAIAQGTAEHLGLFATATGSDGESNNKGAAKAAMLRARFPEGFAYVGDCAADIPVWKAASEVIIASSSGHLHRQVERVGITVDRIIPGARGPGVRDWVKALRLHQWAKNALILVPALLAHRLSDPQDIVRCLAAFFVFGVIASATYILNDISDLAADRAHPTKRNRALARGAIRLAVAAPLSIVMLVGGLAASLFLGLPFAITACVYVATTLFYSFKLKAEPLIDVIAIGGLFTLRIVAGMVLLAQPISLWLASFTLFLFTSLAMAKRHAELVRASNEGRTTVGRAYLASDLPLTTSLGMATGGTAVLVMIMYMELEAASRGLYAHVEPLFLMPLVLSLWLVRIWLRAHRGLLHDDPVVFALKDRVSWGYAGAIVALWMVASYA